MKNYYFDASKCSAYCHNGLKMIRFVLYFDNSEYFVSLGGAHLLSDIASLTPLTL